MNTSKISPYDTTHREQCIEIFQSNLPKFFHDDELPLFESFLDHEATNYFVLTIAERVIPSGGLSKMQMGRSRGSPGVWCGWNVLDNTMGPGFSPGASDGPPKPPPLAPLGLILHNTRSGFSRNSDFIDSMAWDSLCTLLVLPCSI